MTDERRYQDDEVAKIFETAAAPMQSSPRETTGRGTSADDGLTLAELQAIGREVGVPPERIAEAAARVDRRGLPAPRRTDLGMPVGVSRSVDLPRAPTDREWALLVGELRETFGARGRDHSDGDLREWWNGNLHATIEPTESGYRLRLSTLKGDGLALNRAGIGAIAFALILFVILALGGVLDEGEILVPLLLGSMGLFALGANAVRLPRWAGEREEQMEYITGRARALLGEPPPQELPPSPPTLSSGEATGGSGSVDADRGGR
jgi:hypothetical protein